MTEREQLAQRITDYLADGGLFNPEMANHDAVRELLRDCRKYLTAPVEGLKEVLACGTAENVTTSTSEDTRPTASNVSPSAGLHGQLLKEWENLSEESKAKVAKWFDLAAQHLQGILDAAPAPETHTAQEGLVKVADEMRDVIFARTGLVHRDLIKRWLGMIDAALAAQRQPDVGVRPHCDTCTCGMTYVQWSDRDSYVDLSDNDDVAQTILHCALDHSYDRPGNGIPYGIPDEIGTLLAPIVAKHLSAIEPEWKNKTVYMEDEQRAVFKADLLAALGAEAKGGGK